MRRKFPKSPHGLMTPISKDADFKHPEDGMYMIEPVGEHLER